MMMMGRGMPIAHRSTERMSLSIFRWGDNLLVTRKFLDSKTQAFFPRGRRPDGGRRAVAGLPSV